MMNRVYHYLQNYLVYGFVPVAGLFVWSYFVGVNVGDNLLIKFVHEILCYNTMFWFATLTLFMVSIVIVPAVRENTLRRLANLQERDEREEYITGKAARASYIATLSLTLLFIFISMFSFNYSRHSVGISFGYQLFADGVVNKSGNQAVTPIFDSTNYALSSSTLLIILLGWQLLIFNLNARKS